MKNFHANGKLLISGEYLVLDGALSLAVPAKKGQSLKFDSIDIPFLHWISLDVNGEVWFEAKFNTSDLKIYYSSDQATGEQLRKILLKAVELTNNKKIFNGVITTQLEFPLDWGLGSSSTLISCIAKWLNIDPFKLHFKVSNGSGYDIACAENNVSLTYQLIDNKPIIKKIRWKPIFHEALFFVFLKTKQNSKNEVERFMRKTNNLDKGILTSKISDITRSLLKCDELDNFSSTIEEHEKLMSEILDLPTIKEEKFSDYSGTIKSLGAWGGDFILATGGIKERAYFNSKGYNIQVEFKDMIK